MPLNALQDQYFTKTEVARMLRKSVPTLDRWHRLGLGPRRTRIGKTVLYRKDTLEAWVGEQQESSEAR